ncbi:MAG: putative methylated-DNA-protein-cysteine methyltransferase [Frankiales bacterium]|jgi:O-6-methylguanine DNA methyltransferase|nr:putative methylated-DNA-protein-cysteine methyltransferase [Frankiales bacterium]
MKLQTTVDSPIGPLTLVDDDGALAGLYMVEQRHLPVLPFDRDDTVLAPVREQLSAYFAKELEQFDVPLKLVGTPFQQLVWAGLCEIPYGQTWSYGRLAEHLGKPGASRAVGLANGKNPVSVVVPCHRVIGSGGSLTGYGGGLERKRWLLDMERGQVA